jgi:hypothetical protein
MAVLAGFRLADLFPVAAFPAAPHAGITPTREADRANAFAARIAKLRDVGAVLLKERVSLLRGELHCRASRILAALSRAFLCAARGEDLTSSVTSEGSLIS